MRKLTLKFLTWSVPAFALAFTAHGGSITNNFDSGADFVANGVLGTMWDGVYLGYGDVPGGDNGGDGNGATLVANETAFSGFLTLQSQSSTWAGAGDDGFFLYKLVKGDFDVSVKNAPPYDPQNYSFAGLLVRAANLPSGGAFNPTGTNATENWLNLTRFQEFGLGDGVRFATNGADNEFLYTDGDNSDTNTSRYYRITRVGDVFSFYNKTNAGDAWTLQTSLTRGDLAGAPMQVGIEQATFTPNSPFVYLTDFELSGPNVGGATPPANPSGLTLTRVDNTTLTLSWTPGAGSDGSLVVVRKNGAIAQKPADGFVYAGTTNFSSVSNLLGGSGVHCVFIGSGSSVTVTGFGGSNNVYTAAVFSYSGSGAATAYGIAPATNSILGPGVLQAVSFTVAPTNIPIGGVGVATLTASYASGDSYDVSADPNTIWTSSDPSIITVNNGILSALTSGSVTITATYRGISGSQTVSAHTPLYMDDFSVSHDYLASGLPGSTWDGLYRGSGDIPGGNPGSGATTIASANSVTNNTLVIQAHDGQWAGAADDGFFLFKNVAGDFQAAVHIRSLQRVNYQFAGLMARAAEVNGAPYGGSENWVNWAEFGEFGVSGDARTAINGADNEFPFNDGDNTTDFWLLLQRYHGTNFLCFRKVNVGDPWTPMPDQTIVREDLDGVPLQVGLFQAMFNANSGTVVFENFMLDGITPPPLPYGPATNLAITNGVANNSLLVSWTPGAGSTGSVVVVASSPILAQPQNGVTYTGNPGFGLGSEIGNGNYVVYVGSNSSVTVTNLTAGITYYAAVYSYGGSGDTTSYQVGITTSNFLGILESISLAVPQNRIPAGGIAKPKVTGVFSGVPRDITAGASFSVVDPSLVLVTNGILTGLTNGSTTVSASYGGFTNGQLVSVAAPTFIDNFGASHDYLTGGATGSSWDGVYTHPGALPGTTFASDPLATIASADANTSSNGVLTVETVNVGWEGARNDGFFLFKNVPGDFQVAVHVLNTLIEVTETATNVLAQYNNPGLLARAHGDGGIPFVGGTNESWVSWTRFDEFGIGTYARRTLNNATTQNGQPAVNDGYYWLLMAREKGTNFSFYQRLSPTDPWRPCPNGTTYSIAGFNGVPMEVGIQASSFISGNLATSQFSDFMLDTGLPTLSVVKSGGNVILSWPAGAGTLQSTLSLNPVNWQDVGTAPVVSNGVSSVTVPATNTTAFFRLVN